MLFRRIPAGRITPGLERLDLLKPEDRAALTVYTETWSTYVAAGAYSRRVPDAGQPRQRPHQRAPLCGDRAQRRTAATALQQRARLVPGRRAQVGQHHA